MKSDILSHQPEPMPRTEPLIIDRLPSERLQKVRAYIERHCGTLMKLADGGYQITFPTGTQQHLESQDERTSVYRIQFPDSAWLTWYQGGRISSVTGWPQGMSSNITIPIE